MHIVCLTLSSYNNKTKENLCFEFKKKEHNNNHNNDNDSNNNTKTYLKATLEACDSVKYKTAVTAAIKISGVKTEWSQRSKVKIIPLSC